MSGARWTPEQGGWTRRAWLAGPGLGWVWPAAAVAPSQTVPANRPLLWLAVPAALQAPLQAGFAAVVSRAQHGPVPARADLRTWVAALRAERGRLLVGVLQSSQAFWFDEAVREVGAAWRARGDHVWRPDGPSRHHCVVTHCQAGASEALPARTHLDLPPDRWGLALGRGLALRTLASVAQAAPLPLMPLMPLHEAPAPHLDAAAELPPGTATASTAPLTRCTSFVVQL